MRRRLIVPAFAAALAGAAVAAPAAAMPESAPVAPCLLRQAVVSDTPTTVVQALMVINSSEGAFDGWELAFEVQDDARMRAISRMVWAQDGATVTAQGRGSADVLAPGEALTLFFVTDADGAAAPLANVRVDGVPCSPAT